MNSSLPLSIAVALCAGPAAGSTSHPFSVHDMLAMQRISEPRVSPDGKRVVFTVRSTDMEKNKGETSLWLVEMDGSGLRRLTSFQANDNDPRWSTDGMAIFFLSTRSGTSQVWRIAIDGGEAQQVAHLPLDVKHLLLSPDGRHMVFTMEVFPGNQGVEGTKQKLAEAAKRKTTGRVYERIFVRHWDAWNDGRRSHLFVMPVTGKGEPVDVMPNMDADTPSKPFGNSNEFTFSPDGRELVFTARDVGCREPWSTNFNLYRVPIDASSPPVCLTERNEAWDCQPSFSPDGKTMAYLAMARPGYESDRFRIVLRQWPDGEERALTEAWDRSPGEICWSADGKSIYAVAHNLGQHSLFAIDVVTGNVRVIVNDGDVQSPAVSGGGIVCSMSGLKSPAELCWMRADGTEHRWLTSLNAEKVAAARMSDFEQFSFQGYNEETVYAYVVKPVDFDPAKKYPLALLIHGGPQGSYGNTFHYRWNPQVYAGAGYAALMVDFHGSVGYGQAFTDSIRDDWGGKPLEDLKRGLEAAIARYPWMDGDRVGALGASYGGYMINWIAGQWPDRFRCLVNHDGNLDERMAYFNTDELWFPEWEHVGTPWTNPEGYEKQNPVNYVGRWKTPMLVIHGAKDYRIADSQGIGTFNALQRMGIPSKLLYFPDENHWVLAPHNSILWHETVIGWLDQWLKRDDRRTPQGSK
jgi:dipeptidyl aminopeptidase/acylaminoacyl peptidase